VIVGRAVTARYIPHRPDFNDVVEEEGKRYKRIGGQNSWVIDSLVKNDVLVVDLFGKVLRGTFIGDNLGTAIAANTGGTGLVVDGGIRDDHRVRQLPINVLCKGLDPSAIGDVTMAEMNGPIRIGEAVCMPGDIVLATPTGVIFVPPQYAQEVVEQSENTRLRDYWGKKTIADGRYTPGEVDRKWSAKMDKEFAKWKKTADIEAIFAEL
jgi:regulator of RNase E activity RraA